MFGQDRRELELLDARLDAARARLDLSRAHLARAGRRAAGSRFALLAPLTAGALTGAAVQHREPRRGGRFSARELLGAVNAAVGVVEMIRDEALPFLAGLRSGAADVDAGSDADADIEDAGGVGDGSPAAEPSAMPSPRADGPGGTNLETPWPQRIPARG